MLTLRGIEKAFSDSASPDSARAVRGVDLEIREGEFFSLLGPSGCGKTTLLRMIAGLEQPTQGSIELRGQDLAQTPAHRRPFNLVFQKYALFPHLSVWNNVAFGPKMAKLPQREIRARVESALELVKLSGLGSRGIATLSGGQQQRVALARALVNDPEILLLDEPLSALDLKLREQMRDELRSLQKRLRKTFIFVTHDQDEALALSDRIAVMNKGCIEQVGTPQEIYERPATPFVARFIGNINWVEGIVEAVSSQEVRVRSCRQGPLWSVRNSAKVDEGREVQLLVRPEKLRLEKFSEAKREPRENAWEGTIVEAAYHGAFTHYTVVSDLLALRWKVSVPHGLGESGIGPGFALDERVCVSWSAADCRLLE